MKLAGCICDMEVKPSYGGRTFYLIDVNDPMRSDFFTHAEFEVWAYFMEYYVLQVATFGIWHKIHNHPSLSDLVVMKYIPYCQYHLINGVTVHGDINVWLIFDSSLNLIGESHDGVWLESSTELARALLILDWWVGPF